MINVIITGVIPIIEFKLENGAETHLCITTIKTQRFFLPGNKDDSPRDHKIRLYGILIKKFIIYLEIFIMLQFTKNKSYTINIKKNTIFF